MSKTAAQKQLNQARFLAAYRKVGMLCRACQLAKVNRRTVWDWRNEDPAFLEQFEQANRESIDLLEDEARRRAMKGSDRLMMFILKGANPEKYRDRHSIEHSGEMKHDHQLDLQAVRTEMLHEPEYLEFQRQRAITADANPSPVCENGQQRALANGEAPGDPGQGAD